MALTIAIDIPINWCLVIVSFNTRKPIIATHIGLVVTRKVLFETGMYSKEIIQVRKCIAKKMPSRALLSIVSVLHRFTSLQIDLNDSIIKQIVAIPNRRKAIPPEVAPSF